MEKELMNRESDFIQNPDISFIRDSVISLKQEGKCFVYSEKQAKEVQQLFKNRYNKEATYKRTNWYYTMRICDKYGNML